MKTLNHKSSILDNIKYFLDQSEHFKNAYFFQPPTAAHSRRSYEEKNKIERTSFSADGKEWTMFFEIKCSCKNIYVTKQITRDGKTTNMTALKNLLKKLED